ncbi:MAG: hypothetical protein HMLKMBBP_02007 [Planctomycetes bacterium]|nr:hypothetical protein [Planctomycetota bacterium]
MSPATAAAAFPAEMAVQEPPPPPDATSGPPHAVDGRGTLYEIGDRAVVVTKQGGSRSVVPLDDPSDTRFDDLPHMDLSDGRSLRTTAFLAWSAHVRALIGTGRVFETTHRPRKPYHTAFGVAGGLLVGAACFGVVAAWLHQPRTSWREPSRIEWAALLLLFGLLVAAGLRAFAAAGRMWATRRGSYLRVDARGAAFEPDGEPVPFPDILGARPRGFIRCTDVVLRDGAVRTIPREDGPLARPDLIFAALR